jgi:hypothetical protein
MDKHHWRELARAVLRSLPGREAREVPDGEQGRSWTDELMQANWDAMAAADVPLGVRARVQQDVRAFLDEHPTEGEELGACPCCGSIHRPRIWEWDD